MQCKCQQLNLNPEKEKDIAQPVKVQVAAVVTLQVHHLKKEDLKKEKSSYKFLFSQLRSWNSVAATTIAGIKADKTKKLFKGYWRISCP